MALAVIGAGFGRTGTQSLKVALERIGFDPCYHMNEVFKNLEHAPIWHDGAMGKPINWDNIFSGYHAAVDWPACHFWQELSTVYPDAKVILTVRNAESWYQSIYNTIYQELRQPPPSDDPLAAVRHEMANKIIFEQTFGGRFEERSHAIGVYKRHIEQVQKELPHDRLLVYEVAQGWNPLCQFLDQTVPDSPFPEINTRKEFKVKRRLVAR